MTAYTIIPDTSIDADSVTDVALMTALRDNALAIGEGDTSVPLTARKAMPVGTIIDFAGTSPPAGYLTCPISQTNISRSTYAALFAVIGTTWGAGDGSTTFGMPWFAANYAAVQANANVGTATTGQNLAHTHTVDIYSAFGSTSCLNFTAGSGIGFTSSSNGGSANLAAGARVLKCVKY